MDHGANQGRDQGRDDRRDPDGALRRLAEELARDDPRLAALLDDTRPVRHRHTTRRLALLLACTVVLTTALLVPPTVALGATAMVLAIAAPLLVGWICTGGGTAPRAH